MKILVVEDDLRQQMLAKTQLQGHEVTLTDSYLDAFQMIGGGRKFDALLTDMNLPADQDTTRSPLGDQFEGQTVQAGWALVIKGIIAGIPSIGLLTDANHHKDTASSLIDLFEEMRWTVEAVVVGNSKIFLDNEFCLGNFRADHSREKLWDQLLAKVI